MSELQTNHEAGYHLQRIDARALEAHWPWIRERVLIITKKIRLAYKKRGLEGPPNGTPEQIRQVILMGLANQNTVEAWFVLDWDAAIRGFFTTTAPFDEFLRVQLVLYVWHAWGEPGVMAQVESLVEKEARRRGMLAVEHESSRMEWAARHRKDGYRLARMTWRKELS